MNLFGKAKKAPAPKDSIQKLRGALEMLEKREEYLEKKVTNEQNIAKANASKNKRVALMALKRKKAYEAQVTKISGARMTLEAQIMAIESANVNLEAMKAMKEGADAMKSIHKDINIDKVDKTMDDIRDQMDIANEITDAIAQPVGFGVDFDDDELAAELDALEQAELDEQLLDVGSVPETSLPEAPTAEPKSAQKKPAKPARTEEEDELEALAASMAM
eukprot:Colp12_sorted_trinity150504_noHs@31679